MITSYYLFISLSLSLKKYKYLYISLDLNKRKKENIFAFLLRKEIKKLIIKMQKQAFVFFFLSFNAPLINSNSCLQVFSSLLYFVAHFIFFKTLKGKNHSTKSTTKNKKKLFFTLAFLEKLYFPLKKN